MGFSVTDATTGRVKLSGQLTVDEFKALQKWLAERIQQRGYVRALVELDGFQGWAQEAGWQDTVFLDTDDPRSRVAIVGDPRWREDALMFTGAPLRTAGIEYFPTERLAEAQAWLAADN